MNTKRLALYALLSLWGLLLLELTTGGNDNLLMIIIAVGVLAIIMLGSEFYR